MSALNLVQMPQAYPHSVAGLDIPTGAAVNHNIPFPWKLHELLDVAEADGFTNIVSWLPDESSFRVHDVEKFVEHIMKLFFKQTKYKSFQRQLNMWGFDRLLNGPGKGGYSHNYFIRGKPSLCCHMTRLKVKGTGARGVAPSPPPSKMETFVPTTKPTTVHSAPGVPPPMAVSSSATNIQAPQISPRQQKSTGAIGNHLFEEGMLEQVLQCAVFVNTVANGAQGNGSLIPTEGDGVLFEGRQFFLVDDYHPPAESTSATNGGISRPRAQRRMSVEFAPTGTSQNASRPRRRMSLLPVNPMDCGSSIVPSSTTSALSAGEGRKLMLDSITVPYGGEPSRRQCRRFSLERLASSSLKQNPSIKPGIAGYVLRQLRC
jgi:hypothetical protein